MRDYSKLLDNSVDNDSKQRSENVRDYSKLIEDQPEITKQPEITQEKKPEVPHIDDYSKSLMQSTLPKKGVDEYQMYPITEESRLGGLPEEQQKFAMTHIMKTNSIAQLLGGKGTDESKLKKLKKAYPDVEQGQDPQGKFIVLDNKKMYVLKKDDEGYPEYNLPLSQSAFDPAKNPRYINNPKQKINSVKPLVKEHILRKIYELSPNDEKLFGKNKLKFDSPEWEKYVSEKYGEKVDDYIERGRDSYLNPLLVVKKQFGDQKSGKYYWNKPGLSVGDITEGLPAFIDQEKIAITAAGPAASLKIGKGVLTMIGAGSGQEALNQAEKAFQGLESPDLKRVVLSGAIMGGGEIFGRSSNFLIRQAIEKIGPKIMGKSVPALTAKGEFSDELKQALKSKGIDYEDLGVLVREQLVKDGINDLPVDQGLRAAQMRAFGMKGSAGEISRDYSLQHAERKALDSPDVSGDVLRKQFQQDDTAFIKSIDEMKGKTSLESKLKDSVKVEDYLTKAQKTAKKEANKLLKVAQDPKVKDARLPLRHHKILMKAYRNLREIYDDKSFPQSIKKKMDDLITGKERLTVNSAVKFRNLINNLWKENDSHQMAILKQLSRSIQQVMRKSSLDKNLSNEAREALKKITKGYKQHEDVHRAFASDEFVGKIIKGKVAPEEMVDVITSGRVKRRQLLNFKKEMMKTTEGKQLFQNIKDNVVGKLRDIARKPDEISDKINYSAFRREVNKLVNSTKADVLFTKEEVNYLKNLRDIAVIKTPDPGTVNYSNTASHLISYLEGKKTLGKTLIKAIPGRRILLNNEQKMASFAVKSKEKGLKMTADGVKVLAKGQKAKKTLNKYVIDDLKNFSKKIYKFTGNRSNVEKLYPKPKTQSLQSYNKFIDGQIKAWNRQAKIYLENPDKTAFIIAPGKSKIIPMILGITYLRKKSEERETE